MSSPRTSASSFTWTRRSLRREIAMLSLIGLVMVVCLYEVTTRVLGSDQSLFEAMGLGTNMVVRVLVALPIVVCIGLIVAIITRIGLDVQRYQRARS